MEDQQGEEEGGEDGKVSSGLVKSGLIEKEKMTTQNQNTEDNDRESVSDQVCSYQVNVDTPEVLTTVSTHQDFEEGIPKNGPTATGQVAAVVALDLTDSSETRQASSEFAAAPGDLAEALTDYSQVVCETAAVQADHQIHEPDMGSLATERGAGVDLLLTQGEQERDVATREAPEVEDVEVVSGGQLVEAAGDPVYVEVQSNEATGEDSEQLSKARSKTHFPKLKKGKKGSTKSPSSLKSPSGKCKQQ